MIDLTLLDGDPEPALEELFDAMSEAGALKFNAAGKVLKERFNFGGNYCGHNPDSPRFVSKNNPYNDESWTDESRDDFGHQRKAAWFYQVDDFLKEFYYHPRVLPGLGCIAKSGDKTRQRRSEWREDVAIVLSTLSHHIELSSINWEEGFARVGRPTDDGFLYYDTKYWLDKTGLSESRLSRAFSRLVELGYITRQRRWIERDNGKFKALATATLVHLDLYREMGLFDSLREVSKRAYQKLQDAAKAANVSVGRMLRCAVNATQKATTAVGESFKPKSVTDLIKPVVSTDSRELTPSQMYYWTNKLPTEQQRTAFNHRALMLMLEKGVSSGDADIFRDAYNQIVSNS